MRLQPGAMLLRAAMRQPQWKARGRVMWYETYHWTAELLGTLGDLHQRCIPHTYGRAQQLRS